MRRFEPLTTLLIALCVGWTLWAKWSGATLSEAGAVRELLLWEGDYWRLATHLWQQPEARGNLVLLHGLFDHTGLYDKLLAYGLSRQYNVLMFDLPGHGLSTGEPAVIKDFAAYGRAIGSVLGQVKLPQLPCVAMAQSTGCAALVEFARIYPWPFQAAVLLAPLVRPYLWPLNRVVFELARRFITERPRSFTNNADNQAFLEFLRDRDPLQARTLPVQWVTAMLAWKRRFESHRPTDIAPLVVQGHADRTVDWRYNVKVISRLFEPAVFYIPEARHHLVNESPAVRAQIFEAIDAELARSATERSGRGSADGQNSTRALIVPGTSRRDCSTGSE